MDEGALLFYGALLFSRTFFNARHRAKYDETVHCYCTIQGTSLSYDAPMSLSNLTVVTALLPISCYESAA